LQAGVSQRRADAFARFLHAAAGQADHRPAGQAGRGIDFHGDGEGLDAEDGGGLDGGKHSRRCA
jgi:hypothetical protein